MTNESKLQSQSLQEGLYLEHPEISAIPFEVVEARAEIGQRPVFVVWGGGELVQSPDGTFLNVGVANLGESVVTSCATPALGFENHEKGQNTGVEVVPTYNPGEMNPLAAAYMSLSSIDTIATTHGIADDTIVIAVTANVELQEYASVLARNLKTHDIFMMQNGCSGWGGALRKAREFHRQFPGRPILITGGNSLANLTEHGDPYTNYMLSDGGASWYIPDPSKIEFGDEYFDAPFDMKGDLTAPHVAGYEHGYFAGEDLSFAALTQSDLARLMQVEDADGVTFTVPLTHIRAVMIRDDQNLRMNGDKGVAKFVFQQVPRAIKHFNANPDSILNRNGTGRLEFVDPHNPSVIAAKLRDGAMRKRFKMQPGTYPFLYHMAMTGNSGATSMAVAKTRALVEDPEHRAWFEMTLANIQRGCIDEKGQLWIYGVQGGMGMGPRAEFVETGICIGTIPEALMEEYRATQSKNDV